MVCVKHVPDATDIRFDPITLNLIREGVPSIVNPCCLNAIEEGIRIKEKTGGTVSAVSMGPLQAQEALREALAMGADNAFLVSDREMAGADTLATSYTLWRTVATVAKRNPLDLILTGRVAIDGETGQVPPGLAVRLGIPIISNVIEIVSVDPNLKTIVAKHRFDDGVETVEAKLPAVLTITEGANKPRKYTIEGMLRAKKTKIEVWDKNTIGAESNMLGLKGSPTIVKKVFPPPGRKQGELFDGTKDAHEAARWLLQRLISVGAFAQARPEEKEADNTQATHHEKSSRFGEVWVWIEHLHGKPAHVSWELLGEGKRLAQIYGTKLAAVAIGNNVSHLAKDAFRARCRKSLSH